MHHFNNNSQPFFPMIELGDYPSGEYLSSNWMVMAGGGVLGTVSVVKGTRGKDIVENLSTGFPFIADR